MSVTLKRHVRGFTEKDRIAVPATTSVMWATSKFHDDNPKAYAAFVARGLAFIDRDEKAAAD